jgi:hypothetical protein
MSSMRINAPLIDQRAERGSDGRPPEDGNMDCVPVALASMARGLRPELSGVPGGDAPRITGDGLHDAVYGQGYVGMQDPAKFYGVLSSSEYGVRIRAYRAGTVPSGDAPAAQLYAYAAEAVYGGRPVLLSIPSDWNNEPPRSAFAHMVAACDVTDHLGTHLTAMNPWGGFYQTQARAWWVERLDRCAYKAAWVMERMEVVRVSWQQQSDRTGRDDKGHACGEGLMNYLQEPGNAALLASDGLLDETYYRAGGAFLALEGGAIVRGVKDARDGSWHFDLNGAAVLVDVWQQLQAAQARPPGGEPDPVAGVCKAAVVELAKALSGVKA